VRYTFIVNWQVIQSFTKDSGEVKGKTLSKKDIKRIWQFARPYKNKIIFFICALFVGAIIDVIPAMLFRKLLDEGLPTNTRPGDLGLITVLSILYVVVAFGSAAFALIQRYFTATIGESLIYDLRVALYDHVQKQPLAFFTRTQTGSLQSRLNNDVVGAQQAVTSTIGNVLQNTITLAVLLTVMLRLEWRLTLLTMSVLPFFMILARRVGRKMGGAMRESLNLNAEMNSNISEKFNVSGALLVKLFGKASEEKTKFAKKARRVADIGINMALNFRILLVGLGFVAAMGGAVVFYVGGRLAISGAITTGTIGAFVLYVQQLYTPLTQITNSRLDILTAVVSFERVFEVLDFKPKIADAEDAKELSIGANENDPTNKTTVEFKDVWFKHPDKEEVSIQSLEAQQLMTPDSSEWILSDINFSISEGEVVALVGRSGSGKSTTSLLIPRILDANRGSVEIYGQNVKGLKLESLSEHIGVVAQDPHMFHDTVLNNLLYAKQDATYDEVVDACKRARIHGVIEGLSNKYDTMVGERGYRLSGGEKQRMAIARVILKNPEIIILDEATSSLDTNTEKLIQKAFDEVLVSRSALIIAHRLSTIQMADKILVMDEGRIVESGTHDELLMKKGKYYELYTTSIEGNEE
jgi:ATP-binding cassette subfamily B protein